MHDFEGVDKQDPCLKHETEYGIND